MKIKGNITGKTLKCKLCGRAIEPYCRYGVSKVRTNMFDKDFSRVTVKALTCIHCFEDDILRLVCEHAETYSASQRWQGFKWWLYEWIYDVFDIVDDVPTDASERNLYLAAQRLSYRIKQAKD